jgi:ornithine cyclodeaminase/alanine dehydrogenase-like protein (mu-crystallin family)
VLTLTEQQVRERLPVREAVRLMRETFAALRAGTAINQPRRRLTLPNGSTLHSMAGAWGRYFGTKFYSTHPRHGAQFFFFLFDAETAKPLAQMEANYLGQIRTGAASGYATDLLASAEAETAGIIGSGFQAQSQLEAIREVRKLRAVRVWSRSEEKRHRFAEQTGAKSVASAEEAVRGADIVVTATSAKDPVVQADWIADGAHGVHINAMGSNRADRRELPSDLVKRAGLIAVDSIEQSKIESGDLLLAPVDWNDPRIVELARVDRRPAGRPITIFKSNGLGVEDVAAAAYVYEQFTEPRP